MANSSHPSVRFRNRQLIKAETALDAARTSLAEVRLKTILKCKHKEVAKLQDYGNSDGRVCLQCGLFEERYAGYHLLRNELVYSIEDLEPAGVVTVRITAEDYGPLWRSDENQVTLEDLLRSKLSLPLAE